MAINRHSVFCRGLILSVLFGCQLTQAKDVKLAVSTEKANAEITEFAQSMQQQHGFDSKKIVAELTQLAPRKDIIARISKPAESMPWHRYRKIWMTDKRINSGVDFWRQHEATLNQAEEQFGVDSSIIVGIIGVETFFGRIQGDFPVIEALHTLGFYYPKRSKFFRSELEQFYLLAKEQSWELPSIKGSYAGAMGMGQFISSSYRHYGHDFNQDGTVNLFNDPVDMIGSVANYFKKHGWQKGGFVAEKINLPESAVPLVQRALKLKSDLAKVKGSGIKLSSEGLNSKSFGVFPFATSDANEEYWLGGDNFYVITRYNRSRLYALAVYQLSQAIKAKREQELAAGK
ncbi:MAG: lytic murein transglycosylase B [Kangiellaceae bacterium]|nr:lytic murein transglycosylase B [Kangiellaceae bacterium]